MESKATMDEQLELINPMGDLEEEYRAFVEEFQAIDQGDQLHWSSGSEPNWECFNSLLGRLEDEKHGATLCAWKVPHTTYWLVCEKRIIGTGDLRHRLTEPMEEHVGHIGYCVRPSERRKGHGTRMLAMLLEEAAQMGIKEAILICGYDNPGSIGVIENNGGQLMSESCSERARRVTRRYLVPTRSKLTENSL